MTRLFQILFIAIYVTSQSVLHAQFGGILSGIKEATKSVADQANQATEQLRRYPLVKGNDVGAPDGDMNTALALIAKHQATGRLLLELTETRQATPISNEEIFLSSKTTLSNGSLIAISSITPFSFHVANSHQDTSVDAGTTYSITALALPGTTKIILKVLVAYGFVTNPDPNNFAGFHTQQTYYAAINDGDTYSYSFNASDLARQVSQTFPCIVHLNITVKRI